MAAEPELTIDNGLVKAKLYLPSAKDGFYKGKRFDWSGVINSLTYKGHEFYGPWFQERRADVKDFIYDGDKVVTVWPVPLWVRRKNMRPWALPKRLRAECL